MENKFYIKKLDSYEKASEISKIRMGTEPSYDLDLLPSVQMQKEMRKFLKYRGQQLGAEKFYTERRFYHHLCKMLQTRRDRPRNGADQCCQFTKERTADGKHRRAADNLHAVNFCHCHNADVLTVSSCRYRTKTAAEDGSIPWKCVTAGNDIIMPGNAADAENIRKAFEDGKLSEEVVRMCAGRILNLIHTLTAE